MKTNWRLMRGFVAVGLVGCSEAPDMSSPEATLEIGVNTSALSTGDPISVRFISVADSCNAMSESSMRNAVTLANDVFDDAGIEFQFYSREHYPIKQLRGTFNPVTMQFEWIPQDHKDTVLSWNSLRPVWEALGISCSSCASEPAQELSAWLFRIAQDYLAPQMVVWNGCGSHRGNGGSTSAFLGGNGAPAAAHEFGHAFDLPHSFEVARTCSNWDLVYAARGRGIANTYFTSRQSCSTFVLTSTINNIPFTFFKIDPRDTGDDPEDDTENNEQPRWTSGGIVKVHHPRCSGCTAPEDDPDNGVEQYETGDPQIAGYAKFIGNDGAANSMTYCSASGCPNSGVTGRNFFSASQIATVQSHAESNPRLFSDPDCDGGIAGSNVCCAESCGSCGGSGCSSRPGGYEACCLNGVRESELSCTQGGAPCVISDPQCLTGVRGGEACCAPGCGTCGGSGCGGRPGGAAACCVGSITDANRSCAEHMPPCVMP